MTDRLFDAGFWTSAEVKINRDELQAFLQELGSLKNVHLDSIVDEAFRDNNVKDLKENPDKNVKSEHHLDSTSQYQQHNEPESNEAATLPDTIVRVRRMNETYLNEYLNPSNNQLKRRKALELIDARYVLVQRSKCLETKMRS